MPERLSKEDAVSNATAMKGEMDELTAQHVAITKERAHANEEFRTRQTALRIVIDEKTEAYEAFKEEYREHFPKTTLGVG